MSYFSEIVSRSDDQTLFIHSAIYPIVLAPLNRVRARHFSSSFEPELVLFPPIMTSLLLLGAFIAFQDFGAHGCLPRRPKQLTDSYVPVGIQVLYHYESQLEMYLPLCGNGKNKMANPQGDVCVAETMARINLLLIDLQREAAKQNLEDSQGLTRSVLKAVNKTSGMTAAQQFHFILEKLREEQIPNVGCKIAEFQQDLENEDSKLFRNFLNLKPLNYLY